MALKYRIEYDTYTRYQTGKAGKGLKMFCLYSLILASIILMLVYAPNSSFLYRLILPGEPAVTADALEQMSREISSGAALSEALDVFCVAVMDAR